MAAFDAPRVSDRPLAAAGGALAAQPGTFVAAIAASALLVGSTLVLMASGGRLVDRLERAKANIQASIYLDPGLDRTAALALKSRLDALPIVHSALLRSRDVALVALADAGLPSLRDKPNPLPDVWIVTLSTAPTDRPGETLAAKATEARNALSLLPGVEAVRMDDRWIELLDYGSTMVRTALDAATWTGSIVLSVGLFCIFCLTGRALGSGEREHGASAASVAGLIGAQCAVLGLIAGACLAALAFEALKYSDLAWKPTGDLGGQIQWTAGLWTLCGAAVLVAIAGTILGSRMHRKKASTLASSQI